MVRQQTLAHPQAAEAGRFRPCREAVFSFEDEAGRRRTVPAAEIWYFEFLPPHIVLHGYGRAHRLQGRLKDLESQLAASGFVRIQRDYLVNLHNVVWIQNGMVEMPDGELLACGPQYRARLERRCRSLRRLALV